MGDQRLERRVSRKDVLSVMCDFLGCKQFGEYERCYSHSYNNCNIYRRWYISDDFKPRYRP